MKNNLIAAVVDELNKRKELALDDDKYDDYNILQDFYEWFVENHVE